MSDNHPCRVHYDGTFPERPVFTPNPSDGIGMQLAELRAKFARLNMKIDAIERLLSSHYNAAAIKDGDHKLATALGRILEDIRNL